VALPTVAGILQVPVPAFVRKLRRRSDWGEPTDDPAQRVKNAVDKLFRLKAEPDISVYLVSTDEDLRRVALGLNAGRDSLKEAVPIVAFLPGELKALAIQVNQTPGNLPCAHANTLHHDIIATDEQLTQLCEAAMNGGRLAGNCSQGMMKDVINEATKENCRTVTQEGACHVGSCQPA
jgi:hypothetical protein